MNTMNKRKYKNFSYFLCFSLLLSIGGFSGGAAEAREIGFPIGAMVSKGEVRFEAREKVWRNIETSHFPVFQKGKIQTEKGTGIITLTNHCQIEVGPYSALSFDQMDRLNLSNGRISFRIPFDSGMKFKVRSLYVEKSGILQAAKSPTVGASRNEETVGSISLHSNGSVTVKSLQGAISILDQDRVVLAALSSRESITIPSLTVSGKSRTMVAQVGEVRGERAVEESAATQERRAQEIPGTQEWDYLGLNAVEWIAVGYSAIIVGGLTYAFWPEKDQERRIDQAPLCP